MLPKRLKELRKQMGLTQKEVAEKIQVGQNSYSNWENGNRKPTAETTSKLADFFNVSPNYLLGNTEIKNPNELDIEKVKYSLKKSLGFNGSTDIPEEELENMAKAFIEHFGNQ